jgi:alkanesulfonate monooxygenase SsuD/methylene tetrahydromethanopterin reductase-like flavin-dependent oxidoreductase (luciferase family)
MVALSISVEGMFGLAWPTWKQLVAHVEQCGFAGLYRSDHFTVPGPAYPDSLELIVSLTYAAEHTQRIPIGSLVAPLSFRDPIMLARQAAALDDLSGGRMILGVGAGWMEREHTMFGYELGDVPTRIARLADGLEVISRLLRSEEPVAYAGRFYRLQQAQLRPRPQRSGGPPLLVGGAGPRRTLPLVARYADIWSAQQLPPEGVRERSARLDDLLRQEGRPPNAVKRTFIAPVICGRTRTELEERVRGIARTMPPMPLDAVLGVLRTQFYGIVGTSEEVAAQIRAYGAAGIEELMVNWFTMDDSEGLRILAQEVLPRVAA